MPLVQFCNHWHSKFLGTFMHLSMYIYINTYMWIHIIYTYTYTTYSHTHKQVYQHRRILCTCFWMFALCTQQTFTGIILGWPVNLAPRPGRVREEGRCAPSRCREHPLKFCTRGSSLVSPQSPPCFASIFNPQRGSVFQESTVDPWTMSGLGAPTPPHTADNSSMTLTPPKT